MAGLTKKKVTRAYVSHFDKCVMRQVFPTGRIVQCDWMRDENSLWHSIYSTNSAYHICKHTGQFKDCKNCNCYDDDAFEMSRKCEAQAEVISMDEMASRATACLNAEGCTVSFRSSNG